MGDFQFEDADFDIDAKDIQEMDQNFLKSIEDKTNDNDCESDYNAFTFWFLIVILLLFIFLIAIGAMWIIKGKRRRYEYQLVGYRK